MNDITINNIHESIREMNKTLTSDLKEVKEDIHNVKSEIIEIKSKMPNQNRVQVLEVSVAELKAKFNMVYASLGTIGAMVIGTVIKLLTT